MTSYRTDRPHVVRSFVDATGAGWQAFGLDDIVAHGKPGVRLAFRAEGSTSVEPLPSRVTFNSHEAADFALRTLGEKELLRRLALAQAQAGAV
jgi:hypothetical protein